jgi:hypothetical protein
MGEVPRLGSVAALGAQARPLGGDPRGEPGHRGGPAADGPGRSERAAAGSGERQGQGGAT